MRSLDDLGTTLRGIDGAGYGAYKRIGGTWVGDDVEVAIDHVQGDPFATPSRVRLRIPHGIHDIDARWFDDPLHRVGVTDYLARVFARAIRGIASAGSGRSGEVRIDAGGAQILDRAACGVEGDALELRLRVGLPARGRRVLGRAAADILTRDLAKAATALRWDALDQDELAAFAHLVEEHHHLQGCLAKRGLVAFVRDGAILPRRSGISSEPMQGAVPFASPPSLRVTLPTRHHGDIEGMGIPVGVTLITGGGFHGKTTLLDAIAEGIYPHVPGDGREFAVSDPEALKVRSEDGRSVIGVDLRPFITDLPAGRDTARFETEDASGSTSLAAAILEGMELGATSLLLDEDTAATNLLIRDARMQALVARETITPLIDRVRGLHSANGVSTVLVVGGSGDYLEVADTVVLMQDYLAHDVTDKAREIAKAHPTGRHVEQLAQGFEVQARVPHPRSFDSRRGRRDKVKARSLRELTFGEHVIDLGALEQLVDPSQVRTIGAMLRWLGGQADGRLGLRQLVIRAIEHARSEGLYALDRTPEMVMVRTLELGAAINRLRGLVLSD